MVRLGSSSYIDANDVQRIEKQKSATEGYPFAITVYFKSGGQFSVCYAAESVRETALRQLLIDVERERVDSGSNVALRLTQIYERLGTLYNRQTRMLSELKKIAAENNLRNEDEG